MQNARYTNHGSTAAACVWCRSEYIVGFSHARQQTIFCSKKCEIEARFWLFEVLKEIEEVRRKTRRNPEKKNPQP